MALHTIHLHMLLFASRLPLISSTLWLIWHLVEHAGLAFGLQQRPSIAWQSSRSEELLPAQPRQEASALQALAVADAALHEAGAATRSAPALESARNNSIGVHDTTRLTTATQQQRNKVVHS